MRSIVFILALLAPEPPLAATCDELTYRVTNVQQIPATPNEGRYLIEATTDYLPALGVSVQVPGSVAQRWKAGDAITVKLCKRNE